MPQRANRQTVSAMAKALVELFIQSFKRAPKVLILKLHATDDKVHEHQEGRALQGCSGERSFYSLTFSAAKNSCSADLRPINANPALHARTIAKLLVTPLRQGCPQVKIILRGDSRFCRWRILRLCDKSGVDNVVSLAKNDRLPALVEKANAAGGGSLRGDRSKPTVVRALGACGH